MNLLLAYYKEKYTIPECKERDATYAAPLKVKVRLHNKETDEINEHEIFMGDLPLMTETGTFVINGAERVIVSQLVRSPGIYYDITHDKIGKTLYASTVIPNRGAWLEYETDSNDVFSVRVDRTRKVPITVLLRAMGVGTNQQILDMFGEEPKILASFAKDPSITEKEPQGSFEAGLLELYKKIRPGEPLSVESAESLITAMFFDARRYDLAKVGRYKINKKLGLDIDPAKKTVTHEDIIETVRYLLNLINGAEGYTSDDIEDISSTEYVNNLTFNKMVYKVVYNLINLKNHIIGKFWGAYNLDNIMVYDQLEYDDFFQQLRIDRDDDLFVHDNEPMSIMINRIFEKIYDIQETILSHMEAKYRSQGAFTNNSFRII